MQDCFCHTQRISPFHILDLASSLSFSMHNMLTRRCSSLIDQASFLLSYSREFFLNTLKWLNPPVKVLSIRCSQTERERKPVPICQEVAFFLYTCVIPFSGQGLLRVSANSSFLSFFFLIQFKFFLFIYSFPTRASLPLSRASLMIRDRLLSSKNCISSLYASSFFSVSISYP